jgi:outer membrane protein OmpA-like peptidoglycan-associated protein
LQSSSNADLGLMRALSVVRLLQDIQVQTGSLKEIKFRVYSVAQLILPNGEFASINRQADASRRRIEIRFTRLGKLTKVK